MDKVIDITKVSLIAEVEAGLELDDNRGRQDDKTVSKLLPASAGGGGQTLQTLFVNRYRPGNRYKQVQIVDAVTDQFDAVVYATATAPVPTRDTRVIQSPAAANGTPLAGIVEQGTGTPASPQLNFTLNTFCFITTRGKAIARCGVVAVNNVLVAKTTAGTLNAVTTAADIASVTQAGVAAAGPGVMALTADNEAGALLAAGLAYVKLT